MFYSRALSWCISRVCSVSLAALSILVYLAFCHSQKSYNGKVPDQNPPRHQREDLTYSEFAFVCYTIFVHTIALLFPFRLCFGTAGLTRSLKKALKQNNAAQSSVPTSRKESLKYDTEASSSLELHSIDSPCVTHAIIIPNYKEDIDTLRDTLDVLACHSQAISTYDVYLAMEQGELGSEVKAKELIGEFDSRFHSIEHTLHPRGIPGEAQGKSSNLCWAARYLSGRYDVQKTKQNVIVTVLDADSHLSSRHFSHITQMHFDYSETANTTIYVPPIIFDRNAHQVPTIVRVADLFWAGAGLSGHLPVDPITPPTSVYSLPLTLVDSVGGWDAGNEAIGEDLHMYIKAFFATKGNLTCRTVLSPASQSNVHSSEKGIGGYIRNCHARYRQALRHMWGALDSGYMIRSTIEMFWKPENSSSTRPHWLNTTLLLHRLFEAHFLPVHLALLIISSGIYSFLTPPSRIPLLMLQIFDFTAYIRMICLFNFTIFLFLYERYHAICLSAREDEMSRAGLADKMYDSFSYRRGWKNWLDYFAFPVTGVLFGSLPAFVALVCQFWTTELVYKVSKKPQRMALV